MEQELTLTLDTSKETCKSPSPSSPQPPPPPKNSIPQNLLDNRNKELLKRYYNNEISSKEYIRLINVYKSRWCT